MQCDMRDVAFYYRMKKGAGPLKMSDSGLADVLVGGKGVNVRDSKVSYDNLEFD